MKRRKLNAREKNRLLKTERKLGRLIHEIQCYARYDLRGLEELMQPHHRAVVMQAHEHPRIEALWTLREALRASAGMKRLKRPGPQTNGVMRPKRAA